MPISTFAPPPNRESAGQKVAIILIAGLILAVAQSFRIYPVSTSGLVVGWAGLWMFPSVIVFAVLWLIYRRKRPNLAPIATAVIFSLGLNTCVFTAAGERQESAEAISKAAPFIEAFQRGEFPTDDQIRAAKVGDFEPFLLLMASVRRDIAKTVSAYDTAWSDLHIDAVLQADELASPTSRARARAALDAAADLHGRFQSDLAAILELYQLRATAVMLEMPGSRGPQPMQLAQGMAPARDYFLGTAKARSEQHQWTRELLDLVDANPKGFLLVRNEPGEPAALSFRDKALAAQYQALLQRIRARQHDAARMETVFEGALDQQGQKLEDIVRRQREGR